MAPRSVIAAAAALTLAAGAANAGIVLSGTGANGLSGEAEFTLVTGTQLQIRLKNTTGVVPAGFQGAAQILTAVGFDLGAAGNQASDPTITGGNVKVGPTSFSVNFDVQSKLAGDDVSGEWGYSNTAQSGQLANYIAAMAAGTTGFGGPNLDGPGNLDGPQGGLISAGSGATLGGLGAVENEVVITLNLSKSIPNLDFLNRGARFEFGSDAFFLDVQIPTPGAAALAGVGLLAAARRRRR